VGTNLSQIPKDYFDKLNDSKASLEQQSNLTDALHSIFKQSGEVGLELFETVYKSLGSKGPEVIN
jgi:hypothetical protein